MRNQLLEHDERWVCKRDYGSFKHDANKKNEGQGRGQPSSPTRTPRNDWFKRWWKRESTDKYRYKSSGKKTTRWRVSISNKGENARNDKEWWWQEENSGAIAIQLQDTKDFMLALKNTKKSKILQSIFTTAGISKTSRAFKVKLDLSWKSFSEGERLGLSLWVIQWTRQNHRNPNALEFDLIADYWTQRIEKQARVAVWLPHKHVCKTKGTYQNMRCTFFKPEVEKNTCTPVVNQGQRKITVAWGASMHLMGKNDLTVARAETTRASKNVVHNYDCNCYSLCVWRSRGVHQRPSHVC